MTKAIDLASIPQTWIAFTPSVTGWGAGNGTWDSYYTEIGKTIIWRCKFTSGSTTTYGGALGLNLPVTAKSAGAYYFPHPVMVLSATAGTAFTGTGWLPTTTTWGWAVGNVGTTYAQVTTPSSTIPTTWATGAHVNFCVTYEAA